MASATLDPHASLSGHVWLYEGKGRNTWCAKWHHQTPFAGLMGRQPKSPEVHRHGTRERRADRRTRRATSFELALGHQRLIAVVHRDAVAVHVDQLEPKLVPLVC